MGIPSQLFFATSPKHPWMLQTLNDGINVLSKSRFVMRNMPAQSTVSHAYKMGFIYFQKGVGIETNDYVPHGIYEGALDNKTMQDFVDAGIILVGECDGEPSSGHRRCFRVVGNKTQSREFVNRKGAAGYGSSLKTLGMSHYHGDKAAAQKSCQDHIKFQEERIERLNLTLPASWVPPTKTNNWYQRAKYNEKVTFIEPE